MKRFLRRTYLFLATAAVFFCLSGEVCAASGTIKDGVFAGKLDLSGLTEEEADRLIRNYVEELGKGEITLVAAGGQEVVATAAELGIYWDNPELVREAAALGTEGNVIQRYKEIEDLRQEGKVFEIELIYDVTSIADLLESRCSIYDREAVDAALVRDDGTGTFQITEGARGYKLDLKSSIDKVYDYLDQEWNGGAGRVELDIAVQEPRGGNGELAEVTDLLGSCTTDFSSSNSNRCGNIANGCGKINGTLLYPGDSFSTVDTIAPFTEENGYRPAGAYLNGKVIDSVGGGICQVSTTLYNAVLRAELKVTERYNHSMIVNYVDPSADAAIAESSGKDFCFMNTLDYPVYIEGYVKNKKITFNIYGKETRPAGRQVSYESEVLEVNRPTSDVITADAGKGLGYITTEGAHIGYTARLWKIVTEDGKEVSREIVNNSKYNVSPRSAVVGVATDDPQKYEEIMAAIGTGSIDHVKNVISLLTQPPAPAQ